MCLADGEKTRQQLPVIGGIEVWLALWLPGKPREGHAPHCRLIADKLS